MAVGAIAHRAGMLHLRALNLFGLVAVARHANGFGVRLCKYHFPVLRGRVAHFALLVRKGRMRIFRHELRQFRLVRVVALDAVSRAERLVAVCFLQTCVFGIVAIHAKSGRRFR